MPLTPGRSPAPPDPTDTRQLIPNPQGAVYSESPYFLNQSTVRATASACGVGVNGPEGLLELRPVDHIRGLELVQDLADLADEGHEHPGQAGHGGRAGGDPGAAAAGRDHQLQELAAGERLGRRQVPGLAVGPVVVAEGGQAGGHVLQVAEGVGLVEAADPADGPAGHGGAEQPRAGDAGQAARAVVVGGPADGHPEPALAVPGQQALGHPGPRAALGAGGGGREVLGQRAVVRAVQVEVVGQDQLGPGGGRALGDRLGQGREGGRPVGVGRLGAVVDHGRPVGGRLGAVGGGHVGGQALDPGRRLGVPAPVDGPHPAPRRASSRTRAPPVAPLAPTTTWRSAVPGPAPDPASVAMVRSLLHMLHCC